MDSVLFKLQTFNGRMFSLNLKPHTIFKICGYFSENANF